MNKNKELTVENLDHLGLIAGIILEKKLKYHQLTELIISDVAGKKARMANISPNFAGITAAKKQSGRFILATNVLDKSELTDGDILKKYKEQQSAERSYPL